MTLSVGIIGCGWLGKALAKRLQQEQYSIKATSSRSENVEQLNLQGINANSLLLPSSQSSIELAKNPVFSMSHIVIAIPPRLKRGQHDYPEKIAQIVKSAEHSDVEHIILLSSTAVYNGLEGRVDENSTLNFDAEKVSIIHQAEQEVLQFSKSANIVRLAGLIGPERHPGKFLSGKEQVPNPKGSVNLIHQSDAVGIIVSLIKSYKNQVIDKAVFNAASDTHNSREEFYTLATQSANLPVPQFVKIKASEKLAESKIIMNSKVKETLGYPFRFNDLISWLTSDKYV